MKMQVRVEAWRKKVGKGVEMVSEKRMRAL